MLDVLGDPRPTPQATPLMPGFLIQGPQIEGSEVHQLQDQVATLEEELKRRDLRYKEALNQLSELGKQIDRYKRFIIERKNDITEGFCSICGDYKDEEVLHIMKKCGGVSKQTNVCSCY
jgi:hypothetical protein